MAGVPGVAVYILSAAASAAEPLRWWMERWFGPKNGIPVFFGLH